MSAAQTLFIAGTIPLIVAGGGHAAGAVVDLFRPFWFHPTDDGVREAMAGSSFSLRQGLPFGDRGRPTVWRAWLGFNISHGLGLAAFGTLCLLLAVTDPGVLVQAPWLRPLAAATAGAYLVIALRCWFWGPVLICGAATACLLGSVFAPA